MSLQPVTYLRFDGRITEHLQFTRYPGWETDRIAHRPQEGDGEYRLSLLDESSNELVATAVHCDFGGTCSAAGELRSARVEAYVRLHAAGRILVLSRRGREIFREDVTATHPQVDEVVAFALGENKYRVTWSAKHAAQRPLVFKLFFFPARRGGFGIARGFSSTEYLVDLSDLPGGRECRFGVLATDGVRSGTGVSEPFNLPDRPARVRINSPTADEVLPCGHPVGARGQALDQFGGLRPERELEWILDGELVAAGRSQIALPVLEPGRHTLALRLSGVEEQSTVEFSVCEPTAQQLEWKQMRAMAVRALSGG